MAFLYRVAKLILFGLILGYGIYFSLQNQDFIRFTMPPLHTQQVPAYVSFLIMFFFGALVSVLFFGLDWVRRGIIIHGLRRKVRSFEAKQKTLNETVDTGDISPAAESRSGAGFLTEEP